MTTFWDILGVTCCMVRFLVDEGAIDYERRHYPCTGQRKSYPGQEYRAVVLYRDDLSQPYAGEGITMYTEKIGRPSDFFRLRIGIGHESRTVVYSDV